LADARLFRRSRAKERRHCAYPRGFRAFGFVPAFNSAAHGRACGFRSVFLRVLRKTYPAGCAVLPVLRQTDRSGSGSRACSRERKTRRRAVRQPVKQDDFDDDDFDDEEEEDYAPKSPPSAALIRLPARTILTTKKKTSTNTTTSTTTRRRRVRRAAEETRQGHDHSLLGSDCSAAGADCGVRHDIAKKNFDGSIGKMFASIGSVFNKNGNSDVDATDTGSTDTAASTMYTASISEYTDPTTSELYFNIDIFAPTGSTVRIITDATLENNTATVPSNDH
jgi:hypothetical protein